MSAERKRRIVPDLAWEREAPVSAAAPLVPGVGTVGTEAQAGSPSVPETEPTVAEATAAITTPSADTGRRNVSSNTSSNASSNTSSEALETTTVRVRVRSLDWLDDQVKAIRRRSRSGLTRSQLLAAYLTALEELGVSAPGADSPADLVDAIKSRISQSAK